MCKDITSSHIFMHVNAYMLAVSCDTPAIRASLNFSRERKSIFSRASPPPAICLCSLAALLLQRESGEKPALPAPSEGSCHAGLVYSVRHCGIFDWSLSLIALTRALSSTSGSHIFSRTLASSLSFFLANSVILCSINSSPCVSSWLLCTSNSLWIW